MKTLIDCSTMPGHLRSVCDGSHRDSAGIPYSPSHRRHIIAQRLRVDPETIRLPAPAAIEGEKPVWQSGIGDRLHKIIFRETGAAVPCSECKRAIDDLNRLTPGEVRLKRDELADDIVARAKTKAPTWWQRWGATLAPSLAKSLALSWIEEACELDECGFGDACKSRVVTEEAVASRVGEMFVSVRTTERKSPTIEDTLKSLEASGFPRPSIFVDSPPSGSFLAFLECSRQVLRESDSEWLLLCEDDVLFADGLASRLESLELTDEILTLFKPHSVRAAGDGLREVPAVNGSLAVLVRRDVLSHMLSTETALSWPKKDCVDKFLSAAASELGVAILTPATSWVQHIGETSVCQPKRWEKNSLTHSARFAWDFSPPVLSEGVTLITPTGDRHAAFALCEKWMARQTFTGQVQWIVVDDGAVPTKCTMGQQYIRRTPSDNEGHSLSRNLWKALPFIEKTKVLVIEDDEWYAANYVEQMSEWLDSSDLVGAGIARYYWPRVTRYREFPKHTHASLCRTGFRADRLLSQFAQACESNDPSVDLRLWAAVNGVRHDSTTPLVVGMKQMPGRKSGGGDSMAGVEDAGLSVLQSWIGDDVQHYRPFMPRPGANPDRQSEKPATPPKRTSASEQRMKQEFKLWEQSVRDYRPQLLVPNRKHDFSRRSLIFHCYPKLGADWRASCLATFQHRDVFNGKIVVSVTTGDGCDSPEAVAEWLRQFVQPEEINFVRNIPKAGINTTFRDQLRAIRHEPGIVFKSHTKGISHGHTCDFWRDNMLRGCLADVSHVQQKFAEGYSAFGAYKTFSPHGAGVMGQISGLCKTGWPGWHYPGACFWFDPRRIPDRVFSLPSHHYENEAFPCHMIPSELAYSLTPDNTSFRETPIDSYLPPTQPNRPVELGAIVAAAEVNR